MFLILFSCLPLVSSAKDYSIYLNKSYSERQPLLIRDFYLSEIFTDSVLYFTEVNKIKKVAIKANDQELLLETKFMSFNFFSSRNYANYEKEMLSFIKEVDHLGIVQLQARARQALGLHYFYEKMNFAKALIYLESSYSFIKRLSYSELPDKQEMIYNIAFVYYSIGYYNTSIKYLDIAKKNTNNYYETLIFNIINTKGLIYRAKGDDAGTIKIFEELMESALMHRNIIWYRVGQNNLAELLIRKKEYIAAFDVLNRAELSKLDYCNDLPVELKRKELLALIYIKTYQTETALVQIKEVKKFIANNNLKVSSESLLFLLAYEKGIQGEFDAAFHLMEESVEVINDTHQATIIELVKQLDNKDNLDKYFRQQTELEHEKNTKRLILFGMMIIVFLILLSTFAFIQKQRSIFKQRQLKILLERQQIGEELEKAKSELISMTDFMLLKNKELDNYRLELKNIEESKSSDEASIKRATRLNDLLSQAILTEENWITFKKAFESVYVDYIPYLQTTMPNLTQAELRYIILRKMKLSSKEIAAVLGISFDSIRTYKYRIRKKYNIKDDDSLEVLIGL